MIDSSNVLILYWVPKLLILSFYPFKQILIYPWNCRHEFLTLPFLLWTRLTFFIGYGDCKLYSCYCMVCSTCYRTIKQISTFQNMKLYCKCKSISFKTLMCKNWKHCFLCRINYLFKNEFMHKCVTCMVVF